MLWKNIVGILLTIILFSCSNTIAEIPTHSNAEIEQEKRKQARMAAEIKLKKEYAKEKKALENKARLLEISVPISQASHDLCNKVNPNNKDLCLYEFIYVDSNEVNAAADGEKIYVTRAMMNFAKSDHDLAIVLGHEAAHNMLDHIPKVKTNATVGIVLGTILDGIASSQGISTGGLFSESAAAIGATAYSVKFEEEADYVGLYITHLAGFDISEAADFWRQMSIRSPDAIFTDTTHPSNPKRFLALEKTKEEIYDKVKSRQAIIPNLAKR